MTATTSRELLLEAIDALARASHAEDHNLIERRRRKARALVMVIIPAPLDPFACEQCGIRTATPERLAEHCHYVHDAPRPDHWHDDEAPS